MWCGVAWWCGVLRVLCFAVSGCNSRHQFDEDDDVWTSVDQDLRLGNQLLIHKGAMRRREKGSLGTGVRVNGKVVVGVDESGAEVSVRCPHSFV